MNLSAPFVVCGLHRSGTTFVGEILRQAGITVVHEPLNEDYGIMDVPIAYPYVGNASDSFAGLLNDAVHFARPWNKDVTHISAEGWRRMLFASTGGRSGLRWEWLRLSRRFGLTSGRVCLKDPFMTLATPCLVRDHSLKVVCMVRHPAAIHYSTVKQNWRFDIENLMRQPELIACHGADIANAHWDMARKHAAASIALLWKIMVRVNWPLAKDEPRMLMVKHEDLCLDPIQVARIICDHFGVIFSGRPANFVSKNSEGGSVEARGGKVHDFRRDSRALACAWKGKLSIDEERMINDIAGEELALFYPSGDR